MTDQEYIAATAQKIAAMEAVLVEAEAALDVEARARQEGFDYAAAIAAMDKVGQAAPEQARAEAKRLHDEQAAQDKAARAQAISNISRSGASAPAAPRRHRNMA